VSPWYETAFGTDYLDRYPHRDEEEARRDVSAIVRLIDPPKDEPVLDLGCGAGRHLLALHEAGYSNLVGIDLSADLIEIARKRLTEAGAPDVELICRDMREIPHADHFGTILSMFTTFGYFPTDEEDASVVRAAGRALRAGGQLLIDTIAREKTIAELVPSEERRDGDVVSRIRRTITPDGLRVEKEISIEDPDGPLARRESVRLYRPEELIAMFERAGLEDVRAFGSLGGEPPAPDSPRLVIVGRKPQ